MPLDLSHPRRVLPFNSNDSPSTSSSRFVDSPAAESGGGKGGGGQRAIQLRLNQDVLSQLVELVKHKGLQGGGKVQLDLRPGKQPVELSPPLPLLLPLS